MQKMATEFAKWGRTAEAHTEAGEAEDQLAVATEALEGTCCSSES